MDPQKIDLLNIGLLGVACLLAFLLPFELFLFSYAVLGPLHYMTEIGWLHQRQYFTLHRFDFIWLILAGMVFFASYALLDENWLPAFNANLEDVWYSRIWEWQNHAIFLALVIAGAAVFVKKMHWRLLLIALGLVLVILLRKVPVYILLIGSLVPTVIHVYVFTGLFMLQGALKNKSTWGFLSVAALVLGGIVTLAVPLYPLPFQLTAYVKTTFLASDFVLVNNDIAKMVGLQEVEGKALFQSSYTIMIQRFLAFAYTYHYLNWFSKVKVIQWNKVPKAWIATVLLVWLLALTIYWIDYNTGITLLILLSILHVFLEFPLNYRSVVDIWQRLTPSS